LKAAFDAIPDAVLVIGADQRLLYANRRAEELFGTLYFGMDAELILDRESLAPRWWLRTTSRYAAERIVIESQPHEATSVVFRFAGETSASTILTLRNIAEEVELQRLAMDDARAEVQRIFERLSETPLRYDGATRPLSASCGIVSIAADESPQALKERADRALYEAKRQGRARFVVG